LWHSDQHHTGFFPSLGYLDAQNMSLTGSVNPISTLQRQES
jgi:hypothetical protein